jgi:predicted phosphodiesterase
MRRRESSVTSGYATEAFRRKRGDLPSMRYGLFSDVHGNIEAFRAVLKAFDKERVDRYLFVGDVIGYGADPAGCIDLLKSVAPAATVAGNHEWGLLGRFDLELFNEYARQAIVWTEEVLSPDDKDYLASFELTYHEKEMMLVHGSPEEPHEFNYVLGPHDVAPLFKMMDARVCFIGHTHIPAVYYSEEDRVMTGLSPHVVIEPDRQYVINIGSVGQPRDRDTRASCAVYDTDAGTVDIKRVPYNIKACQKKILSAGLPEILALRLSEGT